jgi:hypothetical protein
MKYMQVISLHGRAYPFLLLDEGSPGGCRDQVQSERRRIPHHRRIGRGPGSEALGKISPVLLWKMRPSELLDPARDLRSFADEGPALLSLTYRDQNARALPSFFRVPRIT